MLAHATGKVILCVPDNSVGLLNNHLQSSEMRVEMVKMFTQQTNGTFVIRIDKGW
jgi:hypothetical protein